MFEAAADVIEAALRVANSRLRAQSRSGARLKLRIDTGVTSITEREHQRFCQIGAVPERRLHVRLAVDSDLALRGDRVRDSCELAEHLVAQARDRAGDKALAQAPISFSLRVGEALGSSGDSATLTLRS